MPADQPTNRKNERLYPCPGAGEKDILIAVGFSRRGESKKNLGL